MLLLVRSLIGAVVGLAIIVVVWVRVIVKHVPAYPPSSDALSPATASELVDRLAIAERVSTADLAVDFAASSVSSFQLAIDGPSFFPRILDDIRAAQTSVHIAE